MSLARPAAAAALAVLLFQVSIKAEEPPPLVPTRNVDIVYRITRPHRPKIDERVRWSAGEHRERVDGPDGSATIFDRDAHEVTLIVPHDRTYRKLEGEPRWPIEPEQGAKLMRGGEAKVAGLQCVNWSWIEDDKSHMLCATPDGVALRLEVEGKTVVEARSVTYHKQKPDLFEVPPGYAPALAPEGGADP